MKKLNQLKPDSLLTKCCLFWYLGETLDSGLCALLEQEQ